MSQLEFPFMKSELRVVIGLTGPRHSGKDFVARVAQDLNPSVKVMAIAETLKREVAEAIQEPFDYVEQNKEALRPLLQSWGTEYRRDLYGKNYWLNKLAIRLKGAASGSIIIVPDCRFQNEFEFIHGLGGKVFRVIRAQHIRESEAVDQHVSEQEMDALEVDGSIINDPDQPNHLEKAVKEMLKCVAEKQPVPTQLR